MIFGLISCNKEDEPLYNSIYKEYVFVDSHIPAFIDTIYVNTYTIEETYDYVEKHIIKEELRWGEIFYANSIIVVMILQKTNIP